MIKPNVEFDIITDIGVDFLKENNIKGLILDVDNTLIDLSKNKIDGLDDWIDSIIKSGIKIAVVSNGRKKKQIDLLTKKHGLIYVFFALKPFKSGIKKAKKELNLCYNEIAEIGDQIFTDVWVSNRTKMFSILTKPVEMEKSFLQKFKRRIEDLYKARNWGK
jgi:HAD phosphatase, family IIIA